MRPDHYLAILGTSFVAKGTETILYLDGKTYDRFELAALGVPQLKAARYLHHVLQRKSIDTCAQLAQRIGELPAIKGIGHAAYYVALAILASEGLEARALAVYSDVAINKQHRNPGTKDWEPVPVKFATIKRRKPQPKKRKRAA